jgi:hypothetical protein
MPGAPGVSTHYLNAAPGAADLTAIRTFFNALAAGIPNTANLTVDGVGDIINAQTGNLVGTWSATPPAAVAGSAASGYAAPVGTLVHWNTASVINRHRVKGTTYIVPTVNQFEPGGTPLATWLTTLSNAAGAMRDSLTGLFVVWARPFVPPVGSEADPRDGSAVLVNGHSVPDKAVVLRSRRD